MAASITTALDKKPIYEQLVDVMQALFGVHPGYRTAHAKGVVCEGTFTPASGAAFLSRAPHLAGSTVPITVRFSNATGIPMIPDGDPNASPHGMAIRFHLPDGVETDIIGHSANGFPVGTAEEFLEFLRAVLASGPGAPTPPPIAEFLASHPQAARFVQMPKPAPESFGTESYYSVNAFRFINREGRKRYGRYRIHPAAGEKHLDPEAAAGRPANYLFDELEQGLRSGAKEFRLVVQLAAEDDPVTNASIVWPEDRPQVELGTVSVTRRVADSESAERKLIFDPTHLADGIEASDDPLIDTRSKIYSISYSRRNAQH